MPVVNVGLAKESASSRKPCVLCGSHQNLRAVKLANDNLESFSIQSVCCDCLETLKPVEVSKDG